MIKQLFLKFLSHKITRRLVLPAVGLGTAIGFSMFAAGDTEAREIYNTTFWYISSGTPYLQDWSNAAQITADDDWSQPIAVTGWRGDNLTTTDGVDPQTVLADGETTPLDVIANQSNPNTLTTGGVAEFDGIPNPSVALQGSVTADAPHLVIRINTKGCPDTKYMSVSYKVRDLDASADNAVQAVALQFRSSTTGNYTNVPAAFVPDATEPNQATKVSQVFVNLPQSVVSVDPLFLRIITTNAVGADEWVGIDDINVGCYLPLAASAEISGRVYAANGAAANRAVVTVSDAAGITRTVRTNQFGFYRVSDLRAGLMYIVSVQAKTATYTPQVINVGSDIADFNFAPDENLAPGNR